MKISISIQLEGDVAQYVAERARFSGRSLRREVVAVLEDSARLEYQVQTLTRRCCDLVQDLGSLRGK